MWLSCAWCCWSWTGGSAGANGAMRPPSWWGWYVGYGQRVKTRRCPACGTDAALALALPMAPADLLLTHAAISPAICSRPPYHALPPCRTAAALPYRRCTRRRTTTCGRGRTGGAPSARCAGAGGREIGLRDMCSYGGSYRQTLQSVRHLWTRRRSWRCLPYHVPWSKCYLQCHPQTLHLPRAGHQRGRGQAVAVLGAGGLPKP